jgi:hypothetical protein
VSALGHSLSKRRGCGMSAFPLIATELRTSPEVRFVPIPEVFQFHSITSAVVASSVSCRGANRRGRHSQSPLALSCNFRSLSAFPLRQLGLTEYESIGWRRQRIGQG